MAPGASIFLQWTGDDVTTTGQRDEFGLDNVDVRINSPTAVNLTDFSFDQPTPANSTTPLILFIMWAGATILIWLLQRQTPRP